MQVIKKLIFKKILIVHRGKRNNYLALSIASDVVTFGMTL